jgi:hypothetical protein
MSWKTKLAALALVIGLAGACFGGYYTGHDALPPDPQACLQTVFTPVPQPSEGDIPDKWLYVNGTRFISDWLDRHVEKGDAVYVADYTYTSPVMQAKLIDLQSKGIDVFLLLDLMEYKAVKTEPVLVAALENAGVTVTIGTSPQSHKIMHNKYIVIVKKIRWFDFHHSFSQWGKRVAVWVEEGSLNFTEDANKQGNAITINTCPSTMRGAIYFADWQRQSAFMSAQEKANDPRVGRAPAVTEPGEGEEK